MYRLLIIKRTIENIFIFPFIVVGRIIALLKPRKKEYRVWYFFSFYHTGGAEKVHAQVTHATGGQDCIIYFTRRSANNNFLPEFESSGCEIRDISRFTDNKWLYFLNLIYRGLLSGYINRQKVRPIVFNGQNNFAYKISPWIKKSIPQIDLSHSLNTLSYIRMPFLSYYSQTVMISEKRIEDHKQLYARYKVPSEYNNRLLFIPNAIHLPEHSEKSPGDLKVLYVGRGTPEKRVDLFARIAKEMHEKDPSIKFATLGDVSMAVSQKDFPFIEFHGNQDKRASIEIIYDQSDILLITSDTEGFPMVIMEAMAHGLAIIATPVGDIPFHVKNNVNGYLFSTVIDSSKIVEEAKEKIVLLNKDRSLLKRMSENSAIYARSHFGIERFNADYRKLFDLQKINS